MALVGDDVLRRQHRRARALPLHAGRDADHGAGDEGGRSARRAASTTTGPRTSSPAATARKLYVDRRLQQQRRRERHRRGRGPRRDLGDRSGDRRAPRLRLGAAQSRTAWPGSRRPARCGPSVNERDELGSDLVPDYMTSVRDGGFYGWPYSYYGQHVDTRVKPQRPDLVAQRHRARLRARPAHRLAGPRVLRRRGACRAPFRDGMFVGQHGSWNRKPRSGYKVIFVPFSGGTPGGRAGRRATGFVDEDGNAHGPAGGRRRSTRAARCWWPTTSATSSGGSPRRRMLRRRS